MSQDPFTEPTGDPFADVGGYVIKFLRDQPHLKEKEILELIEYVTDIYINSWGGNLNAFFLNSKITQNNFKGDRKKEETIYYYRSLLDGTSESDHGHCRISGRFTRLFPGRRDNHILSGSGKFLNFHHSFEGGLMLSKEALIRIFFVPFGLMQLSAKPALISSNEERISEFFVHQNCQANIRELAIGISGSILKSPFNNPSSAIFNFVDECIRQLRNLVFNNESNEVENAPSLTLYHFTNFGAGPDINIHTLTSEVFKFYIFCNKPRLASSWSKFIKYHYRNSKFKGAFDPETEAWKGKEVLVYETYKTWRNGIFDKLLEGKTILRDIERWSRRYLFPFKIAETYQILIRHMERRTLEKIKDVADFIVSHKDADYIEKSITRLHRGKSANEIRLFVLRLAEQNYQKDGLKPLVTLEDYAEYLFPDGGNWREIRDLILIAVYERLHDLKLKVTPEELDDENELITEN